MTKCKQCNGSGVVHEHDDYDRMSTFRCPACDGAGETMTNYDRIMRDMTVERMAEIVTETHEQDDMGWTQYRYINHTGCWAYRDDAIQAEIEWLKKECDA